MNYFDEHRLSKGEENADESDSFSSQLTDDTADESILQSEVDRMVEESMLQSGIDKLKIVAENRLYNRPSPLLQEKISALPDTPGVYLYLDSSGKVIYVGKAKRLKRRVSSYFNRRHESVKTNVLVRRIADLRYLVVASEEDALHLENAMIKEYQPRYNILLKDDKSFPWIVVTNEPFPRVFMTRDKGEVGARYYGPYANVQSARVVLELIRELLPIRSCRHFIDDNSIRRGNMRVCLDYHIKKCDAPCVGRISVEEYGKYISLVRQILNGETRLLESHLRDEMEELSQQWRFEEANIVKHRLGLVERYNAKSVIGANNSGEIDLFAYDETADAGYVCYMHLKDGAIVRSVNLEYRRRLAELKEEILSMAIAEVSRRYELKFTRIIAPFLPDVEFEGVEIIVPQRGDKRHLLDVGMKNLRQYMLECERVAEKLDPQRSVNRLMATMKSDFRLSEEPRHIECFDNSNIQGTNPVASCVVFKNGRPSKRDYRHFIIKTVVGANDFASMKEVVHRRYSRMMAEGESLPQLVVIDGGKGQLGAALEAIDELGLRGVIALVGIAKRLEEIYFPGDSAPLYIDKKSESLRVIQALRDEAHRFGITHHRNRRSKGQVKGELDDIKGIGEKTIERLLRRFKSVKRLREASLSDISAEVGVAKAKIIYEYLNPNGEK